MTTKFEKIIKFDTFYRIYCYFYKFKNIEFIAQFTIIIYVYYIKSMFTTKIVTKIQF